MFLRRLVLAPFLLSTSVHEALYSGETRSTHHSATRPYVHILPQHENTTADTERKGVPGSQG
jgi:hypothetical protein